MKILIVLGVLLFIFTLGIFLFNAKDASVNSNLTTFSKDSDKKNSFYNVSLAYNQLGKGKIFNFSTHEDLVIDVERITDFLWSLEGTRLAILVQENSISRNLFTPITKVYASTGGFNYLLYIVNTTTGKTTLLLDKVFGDVRWSKASDGIFYTERYYNGNPLLLDNQSGLLASEEKYYFVSLESFKRSSSKEEFENSTYKQNNSLISSDGNLRITNYDSATGDRTIEIRDKLNNLVLTLVGQQPVWAPVRRD